MRPQDTRWETELWLPPLRRLERVDLRLCCFPYAGGSAVTFAMWPERLLPTIDVRPLQLPGRGARLREAPLRSVGELAPPIAAALVPLLDRPVAFFGHSMGALLAFEVVRLLRRQGESLPVQLYVSGRRAPHIPDDDCPSPDVSDEALAAWLHALNGTPRDVLENPDLMRVILPVLRADIAVCRSYDFTPEPPLPVPITVFAGVDDPETAEGRLDAWREHTSGRTVVRQFPGDHFFLHSAEQSVLTVLRVSLEDALERSAGRVQAWA